MAGFLFFIFCSIFLIVIFLTPFLKYTIQLINIHKFSTTYKLTTLIYDSFCFFFFTLNYASLFFFLNFYTEILHTLQIYCFEVKTSCSLWKQFVSCCTKIKLHCFVSERTFWIFFNKKYNSFMLFIHLYTYVHNSWDLNLKKILILFGKKCFYFFNQRTRYHYTSAYLLTDPYFFTYSELYHPVIFTSVWYKYCRPLLLSLIGSLCLSFFCINYFYLNFLRQLAVWAIVGLLFFWLISGFNFFLKRYRYGKFTSAIMRFWKRTNAIFWLVEGFLFSLFFYYFLNSSQEPVYFYDSSAYNQDYLFSLSNVYSNYFLLLFLICYLYRVLLKLFHTHFKQNLLHLIIITIFFTYIFLLESYQLYYVLTLFYDLNWNFDNESNLWVLDIEALRLRVKQQYLLLALIAKYWHFLFIFVGWVFFVFKCYEQKKIHYGLLGWNLQNFVILFFLNLLFAFQWFKWLFRRFYDSVYYWFFTDSNNINFIDFVKESKLLFTAFFNDLNNFVNTSEFFFNFSLAFNLNLFV